MRTPLAFLLAAFCTLGAQAEVTRAVLIGFPGNAPFTDARVQEWQPWVSEFGDMVFSEW